MQCIRATSTAAMFLFLGTMVPAYAQRDQQDQKQGKTEKQQGRQQQGAPPAAQQQRSQKQSQQPQQQQRAQQPQQQRAQQPQQQRAQQPQQQQRAQQPQQQQRVQQPQQQQRVQQTQQQQRAQRYQQQPQRTQQQAVAWQQQRGWLGQGAWQGNTTWQQGRAQHWASDHRTWTQRGGYGGYYIPQATFSLSFGSQHWFRMYSQPSMYMGYPRFSYGGFSFLLLDPWPEYWQENWYATDDVYVDYDSGYYLYNRRYPNDRLAITVVM